MKINKLYKVSQSTVSDEDIYVYKLKDPNYNDTPENRDILSKFSNNNVGIELAYEEANKLNELEFQNFKKRLDELYRLKSILISDEPTKPKPGKWDALKIGNLGNCVFRSVNSHDNQYFITGLNNLVDAERIAAAMNTFNINI